MNPQLQNADTLRDIHLPDAVSWWPPAIGWWILVVLFFLAIYFIPKLYRHFTFKPLNKVANIAFQQVINDFQKHNNAAQLIQETSKLLRQICMSYTGRESSAQLTGDNWIASLNALTSEDYFSSDVSQLIISAPYQKNIDIDPQILITATQHWIEALPARPSK